MARICPRTTRNGKPLSDSEAEIEKMTRVIKSLGPGDSAMFELSPPLFDPRYSNSKCDCRFREKMNVLESLIGDDKFASLLKGDEVRFYASMYLVGKKPPTFTPIFTMITAGSWDLEVADYCAVHSVGQGLFKRVEKVQKAPRDGSAAA